MFLRPGRTISASTSQTLFQAVTHFLHSCLYPSSVHLSFPNEDIDEVNADGNNNRNDIDDHDVTADDE